MFDEGKNLYFRHDIGFRRLINQFGIKSIT